MNNQHKIAWLAGLLEGEGCFLKTVKTSPNGIKYFAFRVSCNMTDLDVLERVQAIAGGTLSGPQREKSHHKFHYRWNLNRRREIESLLIKLMPFMGSRRQNKIQEVLDCMRSQPFRQPTCGTPHKYGLGCRCDDCRSANAAKARKARLTKKLAHQPTP